MSKKNSSPCADSHSVGHGIRVPGFEPSCKAVTSSVTFDKLLNLLELQFSLKFMGVINKHVAVSHVISKLNGLEQQIFIESHSFCGSGM